MEIPPHGITNQGRRTGTQCYCCQSYPEYCSDWV